RGAPWCPRDGARPLVGAAAAAAARGVLGRFALGHLERRAASARGDRVRVVDLEAGLLDRLQVVDARATQIRGAEGIDDDADALALVLVVALDGAAVEAEAVLEAGAAAALDRDAQHAHVGLGLNQLLDLRRRRRCQRDESVGALLDLHELHRSNLATGHHPPKRGVIVTPGSPAVERFAGPFVLRRDSLITSARA